MNVDLKTLYEKNLAESVAKHPRSSGAKIVVEAERKTVAEVKALVRVLSATPANTEAA